MPIPLHRQRPIRSPALAPVEYDTERDGKAGLTIALVNNMPDTALKATERQFMRLVQGAAGRTHVRFHLLALPSVIRSKPAKDHIERGYRDIAELDQLDIDGLIVTGAEPIAPTLSEERYWREFRRARRLGEDQYAFDHLVLSCGTCRRHASWRHRTSAADAEMFRRL